MTTEAEREQLHQRIADALGWTLKDAQSFSLVTLRELLRKDYPKLAHECTVATQDIVIEMKPKRRPFVGRGHRGD